MTTTRTITRTHDNNQNNYPASWQQPEQLPGPMTTTRTFIRPHNDNQNNYPAPWRQPKQLPGPWQQPEQWRNYILVGVLLLVLNFVRNVTKLLIRCSTPGAINPLSSSVQTTSACPRSNWWHLCLNVLFLFKIIQVDSDEIWAFYIIPLTNVIIYR